MADQPIIPPLEMERPIRTDVILDEDEPGRFGREDIAARLSQFAYVHVHVFDKPDKQPEGMTAEEVVECRGARSVQENAPRVEIPKIVALERASQFSMRSDLSNRDWDS